MHMNITHVHVCVHVECFLKMFRLRIFQSYFTIFYICGLSPFVSFKNFRIKRSSLIHCLPRLINIFFICVNSFLLLNRAIFHIYEIKKDILTIPILISCLATSIEGFSIFRSIPIIWQIMCFTIDNFEKTLQMQYPLKKLQKQFRQKFFTQLLLILLGIPPKVLFRISLASYSWMSLTTDVILVLLKCIHSCHILFYTEFINLSVEELCEKVIEAKSEFNYNKKTNQKLHLMQQWKLIHFKLWHIVQQINSQFGWFLMVSLGDLLLQCIFSIYRTFLYISTSNGLLVIIRKYFFLFM